MSVPGLMIIVNFSWKGAQLWWSGYTGEGAFGVTCFDVGYLQAMLHLPCWPVYSALVQAVIQSCFQQHLPVLQQCVFSTYRFLAMQMAGNVATQLWEEWQSTETEADVFNVNVPLGFKTVDGAPMAPKVLRTIVDMQSQYSSLYSECAPNTAVSVA